MGDDAEDSLSGGGKITTADLNASPQPTITMNTAAPASEASITSTTKTPPSTMTNTNTKSATETASALLISATDKAGMTGIDRERINAILLRESGNSTFMQRQRKMDENTNRKIDSMKRVLREKDSNSKQRCWRTDLIKSTIDPLLNQYQAQRPLHSLAAVIDMDSFFISCHILTSPHLATTPACVGGTSMISTSNYIARKYGVRAAMPGYIGQTLVKELSEGKESLTFVKSDFGLYKQKSEEVKRVLEEFDAKLVMHSLDEAYLDLGPYLALKLSHLNGLSKKELSHNEIQSMFKSDTPNNGNQIREAQNLLHLLPPTKIHTAAQSLLQTLRHQVHTTTGLTCSVGLASNFLLAKIASDVNKPNGQCFVGPTEEEIRNFIHPLSIRKVCGIGRVTEKMLMEGVGVKTVGDLYERRAEIYCVFKEVTARFLMRASIGYSERGSDYQQVMEEDGGDGSGGNGAVGEEAISRKGISKERTFSPLSSWTELCSKLENIALALSKELLERNLCPRTVTLKVKLTSFDVLTRATTKEIPLMQHGRSTSQELVNIVINLLKETKRAHDLGGSGSSTWAKANKASDGKGSNGSKGKAPFVVRLLGVRCSNFQQEKNNQSTLDMYRSDELRKSPRKLDDMKLSESSSATPLTTYENNNSPVNRNPYRSPKRSLSPAQNPWAVGAKAKSEAKSSRRNLYNTKSNGLQTGITKPTQEEDQCDSSDGASAVKGDPISKTDASTNTTTKEVAQCPLCGKQFESPKLSNEEINTHIDSCLNVLTVKQLAKEETSCANFKIEKARKKTRLTHYFTS